MTYYERISRIMLYILRRDPTLLSEGSLLCLVTAFRVAMKVGRDIFGSYRFMLLKLATIV